MNAPLSPPLPPVPDHELLRCIGRGSYGEVWLARNVMGTWRAVKVVRRATFDSDRPYEREFAGIQRYEPLSRGSDGLVQVLHVGRNDASGCFYYVMELADDADGISDTLARAIEGTLPPAGRVADHYVPRTLRVDLDRETRLPVQECAEIAHSLATGLAHLHKHGLVHRDLKPSNVIFVNGRAKLADIGLVACFGEGRSFVGTEGFIPPEGPGRPAADLYALGRVLYEIATGHEKSRFPEIPVDWIDTPGAAALLEFHEIVLRLGEGDVARRYQTAPDVLADLALFKSGKSIRELRALQRRVAWLRGVVAVVAGLLLVAFGGYLVTRHQADVIRRNAARLGLAEESARRELINAYAAQARAQRLAGGLGQRAAILAALTNAARLGPSPEQRNRLRQEAAAALALTGTRFVPAPVALQHHDAMGVVCDAAQERFARLENDGGVTVRRLSDGAVVVRLPPLAEFPDQIMDFSPEGRFLRVRRGAEYFIGDLTTGRFCRTNGVCSFAPADRLITVGARGGPVEVALPGGEIRMELPLPPDSAAVSQWSVFATALRGNRVAGAVAGERRILVWDSEGIGFSEQLMVPDEVHALGWSADGRQLAAGTATGDLLLWSWPDTNPRWVLHAHASAVRELAFSTDGRWLASASEDETLKLFDVQASRELARADAIAWSLGFGPDGHRLALVWRGGEPGFLVVEPPTAFALWRGSKPDAGDGAVAFSPDGRWLVAATATTVDFWRMADGSLVSSEPAMVPRAMAFGSDSHRLWVLEKSGTSAWTLTDAGTITRQGFQPGRSWMHLGVSAGSNVLALADAPAETVTVYRDDKEPVALRPHEFVRFVALSGDGRAAASGSLSVPHVKAWDTHSGQLLADLPSGLNVRPAFSPDGRWLAASGPACSLWRTADWRPGPGLPSGPANTVSGAAAFSPDSTRLAAVYGDHEVHLFRLATATQWLVLEAPGTARVLALAFSPDGRSLAATTVQGEVLIWRLSELDDALTALGLGATTP